MLLYLIFTLSSLIISILLFLRYNNGKGGALASFKKRAIYFFSLMFFILFIILSVKTYYYNEEQSNKQLFNELKREYCELEVINGADKESLNIKLEKQARIGELLQQIDNVGDKECDAYFNIFIGIMTTFIAFVIVFTFKNKILG